MYYYKTYLDILGEKKLLICVLTIFLIKANILFKIVTSQTKSFLAWPPGEISVH